MNGAQILVGRVVHRRSTPAHHAFTVPAFMLRLPMNRPDALRLVERSWWIRFDPRDHGARSAASPLQWVRDLLALRGLSADGDIELVCFPRMLGYSFKPVSFWICRGHANAESGAASNVIAVVAEVRNTFGEMHAYVLANADGSPLQSGATMAADKAFHVSPFLEVKGGYRFRFDFGPERFAAHIDYHDGGATVVATSFAGRARPLTRRSLAAMAIRFPVQSMATTARIHWHALRLWAKRVPWFSHPGPVTR